MSSTVTAEMLELVNTAVKGRLPATVSGPTGFVTRYDPVTRVIRVDHVACPEFWLTIPLDSVKET